MADEQLYQVGSRGPVVKDLGPHGWKGVRVCEVMRPGVIGKSYWGVGTVVPVREEDLTEVSDETS